MSHRKTSREINTELFWLYSIALGGIAFCSFVLFLVPVLRYDQVPLVLAFELWIAVVVTSMGVWVAMSVAQNLFEDRLERWE